MNKLISKVAIKVLLGAILCILIAIAISALDPIITNKIALGQLENSDYGFIMMEKWNTIRNLMAGAQVCIGSAFGVLVVKDVYDYVKNKEN